jgi:hypothetical protein
VNIAARGSFAALGPRATPKSTVDKWIAGDELLLWYQELFASPQILRIYCKRIRIAEPPGLLSRKKA